MAIGTGAAIIGAGLGAAAIGSRSSRRAAETQSESNAAAIAEQRRQFKEILRLTAPQREISNEAMNAIASMLGLGGDTSLNAADALANVPGNEVIVDDITRRIRQASPTTGGNVLTALADRVSGFQSDRLFQSLFGLAGLGAPGTSIAAQGASNTGNAVSRLLQSSGIANASGILGQGQSINAGLQNILQFMTLQNMLGGNNAALDAALLPMFSDPSIF